MMTAYINFPPGRRPTEIRDVISTVDGPSLEKAAPLKPKLKVKQKTKSTRCKYKKEGKGSEYEMAMVVGIKSLHETGENVRAAYSAIATKYKHFCASIPKSTLRSRYQKQLETASENEKHECDEDDLALFDCRKNDDGERKPGEKRQPTTTKIS